MAHIFKYTCIRAFNDLRRSIFTQKLWVAVVGENLIGGLCVLHEVLSSTTFYNAFKVDDV